MVAYEQQFHKCSILKTKYRILNHKVYQQEAQGTYNWGFPLPKKQDHQKSTFWPDQNHLDVCLALRSKIHSNTEANRGYHQCKIFY
uniref:Uncharacterized protein n=1 Tax=Rhizophora mucronata TaxID=61149 RepID=A0A2P2P3Z2_RHIMU